MKILRQLHNPTALELRKSTNELKSTKLVGCQIKLDAFTLHGDPNNLDSLRDKRQHGNYP
jgi:hypothetical protein